MPSSISEGWRRCGGWGRTIATWLVGATSISVDFYLAARLSDSNTTLRGLNAAVAVSIYLALAPSPRADLGLRLAAKNGAYFWLKLGIALTVIALAVGAIGIAMLHFGYLWRATEMVPAVPPHAIWERFRVMCVEAPVLEEILYRLIVCVPLAICGERMAIIGSGLLFAGLHFIYGNPSPENFLGGYFLAWAYLRSETILVPIAFHAGGNGIALGFQIAAWYVLYQ